MAIYRSRLILSGLGEALAVPQAHRGEIDLDWTLEVVVVPVSDVDRAKTFYADAVGFTLDHDVQPREGMRIVQLTPPGSGCSIVVGEGIGAMEPGSLKGLQLVVSDIEAARSELVARGVDVSEIERMNGDERDGALFAFFKDPDGNGWAVQEIKARGG
jgi:predicted enzyme related to lactoylglutathione lyase